MTTTIDRVEETAAPLGVRSGLLARDRTVVAGWAGVCVLGLVTVWLGVVGAHALASEGDLGGAISRARGRIVGPGLLASVVGLVVAERIWPAVRRPLFSRGHLVDASYLGLFALCVPALTVVQTGFSVEMYAHARVFELERLGVVPRWLVVAGILVGMDAMNWLLHVANHRFATLWRLHALHHSQEEMSVLTTFRTHPLVHASYLPALLPILILGAGGPVPNLALIVYGCLVTAPHANLRWTFGPLGRVLVSPAFHRMHHAATPPLGALGCNFGFVLATWDRLAHLAVDPPRDPVPTGLPGRPVPVENAGTRFRPLSTVLAQLTQPFCPGFDRRLGQ